MTFVLTLLFMTLVFLRPQDWIWGWLSGWPLLDAIVFLSILFLMLEGQDGRLRYQRTPAIMLTVWLWISTIVSHVPHTYFQGIIDTIPVSFKPCFFLLLLLTVLNTTKRIRIVSAVIVAMVVVMSVHALLQQQTGAGFMGQRPYVVFTPKDGWYTRSIFFGIFGDPNDLAQMLAAAIPLVFAIPRRLTMITLGGTTAVATLLLMALLSTHSRGGMVALLATSGVMVMLMMPTRWMPWLIGAGLAGFLAMCAIGGSAMLDMSSRERIVFWGLANYAFKSNPIFGIGFDMFWTVAGERAGHNAFVTCYTELGIFGYWFWFSLILLGTIGCWRTRLAFKKPKTVEQALLRRLAGLGIASIVGFSAGAYFLSRTFIFPYFFLIGIVNVIPLVARRYLPAGHPPLIDVWRDVVLWGSLTTVLSIIYIYISIILLNR